MRVKPLLGDWEVPHIATIETLERRDFAELEVPGRRGNLFQDLDARPTRIAMRGSLFGDEARDAFLEEVRGKFRAGEPLTFVADITTATDVQYVLVETMHFAESGTAPDETSYLIVLTESPPPPPPPDPLGGIDTSLLDQAGSFLDSVAGALDALEALGSVPDLGDPTEPLSGALDQLGAVTGPLTGALTSLTELFTTE